MERSTDHPQLFTTCPKAAAMAAMSISPTKNQVTALSVRPASVCVLLRDMAFFPLRPSTRADDFLRVVQFCTFADLPQVAPVKSLTCNAAAAMPHSHRIYTSNVVRPLARSAAALSGGPRVS